MHCGVKSFLHPCLLAWSQYVVATEVLGGRILEALTTAYGGLLAYSRYHAMACVGAGIAASPEPDKAAEAT